MMKRSLIFAACGITWGMAGLLHGQTGAAWPPAADRYAAPQVAPNAGPNSAWPQQHAQVRQVDHQAPATPSALELRNNSLRSSLHPVESPTPLPATTPTSIPPASPQAATPLPPEAADAVPTLEQLQAFIADVNAATGIDAARKAKLLEFLEKATVWRQLAAQTEKKVAQLKAEIEQAPRAVAEAKARLAAPVEEPKFAYPADVTLAQLEQELGDLEAKLAAAQEALALSAKNVDGKARAERKAELAKLAEATPTQLADTEKELAAAEPPDDTPGLTLARRALLLTRRQALQLQLTLIDVERRRDAALVDFYALERDLAQRQFTWLEKAVAKQRELVSDHRKLESERQAADARRKASQAHPALKSFAERNAELTEQRSLLSKSMEKTAKDLDSTSAIFETLKEDFDRVTNKVEVGGMTAAAGLLLRNRGDHLPTPNKYRSRIKFCSAEMQQVQLQLMDLEDERRQLGDLDALGEKIFAEVGANRAGMDPTTFRNLVRDMLQSRRQYLDDLLGDYKSYHDDLSDLELSCRNLLKLRDEYAQYVDERVLWIRSEQPLQLADLGRAWDGTLSFTDGAAWARVGNGLIKALKEQPLTSGGVVAAIIALFVFRTRMRRRLLEVGGDSRTTASIWPTVQDVILTLLIASIWPLVMYFVGWLLSRAGGGSLATVLAHGLEVTAVLFWTLAVARQICQPQGLGEEHFGWSNEVLRRIHRSLLGMMIFGLPTLFLVTVCDTHQNGQWQDSLGRLVFLIGMGLLTALIQSVVKPRGGVVAQIFQHRNLETRTKLCRAVWLTGVGAPLALMTLSLLGYTYSAHQLLTRLNYTLWLVVGVVLIHALFSRGCDIFRRRLALKRQFAAFDAAPDAHVPNEEEVRETNTQLRQLLRRAGGLALLVGTMLIWADMFPAFGILNQVELWTATQTVYETVTDASGNVTHEPLTKPVAVTLVDLLVSILILTATLTAARAVPGLLQVTLLQRLRIDNGGRHAIGLICRYALTLAGMLTAFSLIGISWASLQWLAAAMTVGLGFGLQEIFANFVSGIIILLERPIRVGDIVTVDGTTGSVTRMQIRATTITDGERRELIVPNKKFITENVVNWTLTDPITRFTIPVKITYNSDSTAARDLLLKLAMGHPLIMKDPAPSASVVALGETAKSLELRAFLANRAYHGTVQHDLNIAIEKAFAEAGIELSAPPQEIVVKRAEAIADEVLKPLRRVA